MACKNTGDCGGCKCGLITDSETANKFATAILREVYTTLGPDQVQQSVDKVMNNPELCRKIAKLIQGTP